MKRLLGMQLAVLCAGLVFPGCRCGDPEKRPPPATGEVRAGSTVLATIPADASPELEFFFGERGGGVAWVAGSGGRFQVVHDGRVGGLYAAVASIAFSPDGRRIAHGALVDGKWRMVVDGEEGAGFDAVEAPVFSPDGAHVAYRAKVGEKWHLVVDGKANAGTRTRYAMHAFGGDSARIVFVDDADAEDRGRLVVTDLPFEKQTIVDGRASGVVLSVDGTRIAAIGASDGKQRTIAVSLDRPEAVSRGPVQDAVFSLAFGPDGVSLAYIAVRSGERFMVLDDREEPLSPDDQPVSPPVIRPGKSGLGLFVVTGGSVTLREFFREGSQQERSYQELEGLTYSGDGRSHAYAALKGERWLVVANGKEGPPFDRVVSPAFSPDGRFLVYRARQEGKRFVVVADADGKTVRQHPAYEQVFPVRFTADGKSVAYGVKDGRKLAWKVEPL